MLPDCVLPSIDRILRLCASRRPWFLVLAGFLVVVPAEAAPLGGIRGIVVDRDFGVPLPGARVSLVEAALVTRSRDDGGFIIEHVPIGTYTVTITCDGYDRETVTSVAVSEGRLSELRIELLPEVIDMEELVVTGADLLGNSEIAILEIRAESVTLQDSISAELISKAGAGDAAGALKLVVGASVVDGKYATVRGLSDRYAGTTMNHVRIPSADPRKRAVQIDLFPTGTIDSVTVTKTFSPDLQGDFTGGGIEIKTKSIPDSRVLDLSISLERDGEASGNERFLTYDGGGVGSLGYGLGDRGFPELANQPLPAFPSANYNASAQRVADAEAWDRFTKVFDPVIGVSRETPGLAGGLSLVAADRFPLGGDRVLGVMGALTYSHKYDFFENGENNVVNVSGKDSGFGGAERSDSRGLDELLIGTLGTLVYQQGDDLEIALRAVVNHGAEDEARVQEQSFGADQVEQNQTLRYVERGVRSIQLAGIHRFSAAALPRGGIPQIDWTIASNRTRQDEPDVRFFRNRYDGTNFFFPVGSSTPQQNSRRLFRGIVEDNLQVFTDFTLPFGAGGDREGKLKIGLWFDDTDRRYGQDSFFYQFTPTLGNSDAARFNNAFATYSNPLPGALWTDVFLDAERIGLAGNRCPIGMPSFACAPPNQLLWAILPAGRDVDYSGEQRIEATYAMAELPLPGRWTVTGGARLELTEIAIDPFTRSGLLEVIELQESGDRALVSVPAATASVSITDRNLLPALGVTWEVRPQMNLRFAWSRTIARPTFRELAPVATEEFIAGDEFVGSAALKLSTIRNWDARWEWFRKSGDVLAASLFYKEISDPIELINFGVSDRYFVQPVNYETGRVKGFELEARTALPVDGLELGANYTWIDSEVDVPPAEIDSLDDYGLDEVSRRLQGQPEMLLNLNLTYDNDRRGVSAGLFYTYTGELLQTGAARGGGDATPNLFEQAVGNLDFKIKQQLWEGFSVSLKATNLLRADRETVYRTPDGHEATKSRRDTAERLSIAAAWSW